MDNTSFAPDNNSINNSVPPPTPQYSLPEHKHFLNKKFIVTFVILLLLGSGAYAGIWMWQNQQVAQEVVSTFTPRADATAGWETYTNTQYGFEFKYPVGWYNVTNDNDKKYGALIHLRSTLLEIQSGGVAPEGVEGKDFVREGYEISAGIQEKKKLVVDITKSIPNELISTKLNIPNVVAYRTDDIGGLTAGPTVYIENLKDVEKYITISNSSVIQPYTDSEKVFSQILSTFKFTDSADTSTWKTYTNTKYGFTLTFTDAWKGYKVFTSEGSQGVGAPTYLQFAMPTSDKTKCVTNITDQVCGYVAPLTITIIAEDRDVSMMDGKISEDRTSAYYYSIYTHFNELPQDLSKINFEIQKVISTFKFTK